MSRRNILPLHFVLSVVLGGGVLTSQVANAQRPILNAIDAIDVGGWLAWGYYDNSHGFEGQLGNTPLGFNNIASEPVIHQMWTHIGKEAQTGQGIDLGFRADVLFGADGPNTVAFGDGGWDASWATSSQYGFAAPQLYGDLAVGKTRLKAGRFFTIMGYEVVQAPQNFFYSRAYTMNYNQPFTHTGFLLDRPLGRFIQLYGGWTAGWDSGWTNRNNGSTFLGGASVKWSDRTNLIWTMSFGDPGDDPLTTTHVYLQSLVLNVAVTDRLRYVFHSDFQTRTPDPAAGAAFKQYGINQYMFYDITQRISVGGRYEWFYVGENVGLPLGTAALTPGTHYHAVTLGANYRPRRNMIFKPEMRYDTVDFDGPAGGPFDRGTARSQVTWGFQSILTY